MLADGTLAGLQQDTKAALTEIRELVHGVFPPILADRGLVVAVEQRSARLPIPVRVDTQPVRRRAANGRLRGERGLVRHQ